MSFKLQSKMLGMVCWGPSVVVMVVVICGWALGSTAHLVIVSLSFPATMFISFKYHHRIIVFCVYQ